MGSDKIRISGPAMVPKIAAIWTRQHLGHARPAETSGHCQPAQVCRSKGCGEHQATQYERGQVEA
jgi:hypothetical protein